MEGTKRILIKPMVTEKSSKVEKEGKYVFMVEKTATKHMIKREIKNFFGVDVVAVNTSITPGKLKSKMTKKGVVEGRKSATKKAYITLKEGQSIDIYS